MTTHTVEQEEIRVGYLALTDCAPVVVAAALGFDQKYGIRILPSREPSWAAVRDKLLGGALDAAQLLYGLVYGVELGIAGPRRDMAVLMTRLQPGLGLNNPYEKRKVREELSMARAGGRVTTGVADTNDYGGSGTFFKRMQQEAEQAIRGEKDGMEDKKPAARVSGKSSALKL